MAAAALVAVAGRRRSRSWRARATRSPGPTRAGRSSRAGRSRRGRRRRASPRRSGRTATTSGASPGTASRRSRSTGVGADNFRHDYLRERRQRRGALLPALASCSGRSRQTGLIGALLLFGGDRAARSRPALRAIRRRRGCAAAAAAGGAHRVRLLPRARRRSTGSGSCPRSAASAFALLGIAAGLRPAPRVHPRTRARARAARAPPATAAGRAPRSAPRCSWPFVPPLLADRSAQARPRHVQRGPAPRRARRSTCSTAPPACSPARRCRACSRRQIVVALGQPAAGRRPTTATRSTATRATRTRTWRSRALESAAGRRARGERNARSARSAAQPARRPRRATLLRRASGRAGGSRSTT